MSGTETSYGKRLWSSVVASTAFKTPPNKESPKYGDINTKRTYAQPSAQKKLDHAKCFSIYGNSRSDHVKGEERQKNINEPTDELEIMKNKLEKKDIFLAQEKYFKEAAEKDSLVYLEKIKEVEARLEAERQMKLACEKELNQCKGIIEDLHQSYKTPAEEDSQVNPKQEEAHKLVLDEIEKLKKQLEEETSSNLDLISKLGAQESMKQSLELKFTELTEQLNFALATSEETSDAPEISATENIPEMISVSSQTEDAASENVSDQKQLPNIQADLHEEFPKSEDLISNSNHVAKEKLVEQTDASESEVVFEHQVEKSSPTGPECRNENMLELTADSQCELSEDLAAKVEVSEPEEVSELVQTNDTKSVSKQGERKPKSRKRRRKKRSKRTDDTNLVIEQLTQTEDSIQTNDTKLVSKQEERSEPVPTTETESVSKQDGVSEEKPKKCRHLKNKTSELTKNTIQCEVIEELPEPQDGIGQEDSDSDANSKMVYNPSLWRRFKKFLTPACLRQYKHKKKLHDPE